MRNVTAGAAIASTRASAATSGAMALIGKIARWPILLLNVGAVLAFVHRYEPSRSTPQMALDHLGHRVRRGRLGCALDPVLLVHGEFRRLQQDLRLARAIIGFMG